MAVRTIKKYSNRRLYDTGLSRYVTLEELAEQIREGVDVRVVDASDGADITQPILAQIILESRGAAKLLPVPLLMRLIRLGDAALAEFVGRYVSWALDVYLRTRKGAEAVRRINPLALLSVGAADALAHLWSRAHLPWSEPEEVEWSPPTPDAEEAPEPPQSDPSEAATQADVADLRREIDELKGLLRAALDK